MQNAKLPNCGHETAPEMACPACSQPNAARHKPTPPPEVANWVITPTPPEMLEQLRREFNEEEYLAAVRELERTGGVRIDDLIEELKREAHGSS